MRYFPRLRQAVLTIAATCLVVIPAYAQAPQTERANTVANGELLLEGSIQSILVLPRGFVLNAIAFTLANGKSSEIKPPKQKQVLIADATTILVRGNESRKLTPDDLKPNHFALVIGSDPGSGKPLTARKILVWETHQGSEFSFAARVPPPKTAVTTGGQSDTPKKAGTPSVQPGGSRAYALRSYIPPVAPEAVGALPQEQTVDGVTARIESAKFVRQRLELLSYYSQEKDGIKMPIRLSEFDRNIRLYGPDGHFVQNGVGSIFRQVDPRWSHVSTEISFALPDAPPEALGQFEEEFAVSNLALPRKFNEPVEINKTFTTKHGTRVWVRNLTIGTREDNEGGISGAIVVKGRIWPSPRVERDHYRQRMQFASTLEAVDGTWKSPNRFSGGISGANEETTLMDLPIPPATVRHVNFKLNLKETVPDQRDQRWFRNIRIDFKLPEVTAANVAANKEGEGQALFSKADGLVVGEIDRVESSGPMSCVLNLLLHDRIQPPNPNRYWALEYARARDSQTGEEIGKYPTWDPRHPPLAHFGGFPFYWKVSGELVPADARSELLAWSFKSGVRSQKLDVEVRANAVIKAQRELFIKDIAIPREGASVTLDKTLKANDGRQLTLETVTHRKLPANENRPAPIATVEFVVSGELTVPKPVVADIRALPTDGNNEELRAHAQTVLQAPTQAKWSITVHDIPANAKTLNLRLRVTEVGLEGSSAELSFKGITIPPAR